MSDLYNDLYQDLEPTRFDKTKPMDMLRVETGLAFENVLEAALVDRQIGERPGEFFTEEGIAFSPDIIAFEGAITVLGEIKVTWMSAKDCPISDAQSARCGIPANWDGATDVTFPAKFDKYFTQMKAYCYHLGTPYARLMAFFVNGTYRPPTPAQLTWDFEFSARELLDEWAMLKNHGKHKGLL